MESNKMTTTTKILLVIIGLITASALGFIIYQQHTFNQQALQIQQSIIEMKQLNDNVVRSQSQYVNQKGFDDFVKQNQVNLDSIQKDIASIGGQIAAVNVVVANSQGQNGKNVISTITQPFVPAPNQVPVNCADKAQNCQPDPFNYHGTTQTLQLNEDFGKVAVPIGAIHFSAGSVDNKPWNYEILPRTYNIDNTIAHTPDGQTLVYNSLSIKAGDNSFTIPITNSSTVEKFPANSFTFWNPRLALGISTGANFGNGLVKPEATPSLSISISSYGKTTSDPDVRFFSVGVGYNMIAQKPAVEFSPAQFNVGKMFTGGKLINNLWLGPTLGVNTAGGFQGSIGFQVGL